MAVVGRGRELLLTWIRPLIEAGVIPPEPRRVIIDIASETIVKVYYECDADKLMFTIDLAEMLKGADAIGVADMPEKS